MITLLEAARRKLGFRKSMKKILDKNWSILENADDDSIQAMNYYFTLETFPEIWDVFVNKELTKFLCDDHIERVIERDKEHFDVMSKDINFIKRCQEAYYVGICAMLTHPFVRMNYEGFELLPLPEERLHKPHFFFNAIGDKFPTDNKYTPFIIPGTDQMIITDPGLAEIRVSNYFEQVGAWHKTNRDPL